MAGWLWALHSEACENRHMVEFRERGQDATLCDSLRVIDKDYITKVLSCALNSRRGYYQLCQWEGFCRGLQLCLKWCNRWMLWRSLGEPTVTTIHISCHNSDFRIVFLCSCNTFSQIIQEIVLSFSVGIRRKVAGAHYYAYILNLNFCPRGFKIITF